jgi:hypothetical protein
MIFEIRVLPLCKQMLKLTLCFLRSSRKKVYSHEMGMINPEIVVASFVVFESQSFFKPFILLGDMIPDPS